MIHERPILNRPIILLLGLSLGLFLCNTVRAESAHERVALMLSGPDCPSAGQAITDALQQQTDVLRADQNLMPGHVLVDIVRQEMTEETVIAITKVAIGAAQCQAEIMKSCITAGPLQHDVDPLQPVYGQAHSH
jgi:hypothetical protein